MDAQRGGPSDAQVEVVIGNLLRIGVMLSAIVVLIGGVIYLAHYGNTTPDHRVFHGEPAALESPIGVVRKVGTGSGEAIIQLGLLLLIATPIARVAFSVFAFAVQRDGLYVFVTLIVLSMLLFSLTAGGR